MLHYAYSLIHAQHGDPHTGAPGCDFRYLVHQTFEPSLVPLISPEFKYHAEMFWNPGQAFDILFNELGGSVVVVEDGKGAIEEDVVGLPYADVYREEEMYDNEDEEMELGSKEFSDRSRSLACGPRFGSFR